jgi:hypothetical protein
LRTHLRGYEKSTGNPDVRPAVGKTALVLLELLVDRRNNYAFLHTARKFGFSRVGSLSTRAWSKRRTTPGTEAQVILGVVEAVGIAENLERWHTQNQLLRNEQFESVTHQRHSKLHPLFGFFGIKQFLLALQLPFVEMGAPSDRLVCSTPM